MVLVTTALSACSPAEPSGMVSVSIMLASGTDPAADLSPFEATHIDGLFPRRLPGDSSLTASDGNRVLKVALAGSASAGEVFDLSANSTGTSGAICSLAITNPDAGIAAYGWVSSAGTLAITSGAGSSFAFHIDGAMMAAGEPGTLGTFVLSAVGRVENLRPESLF